MNVTNEWENRVAFKTLSSNYESYQVCTPYGFIEPGTTAPIEIIRQVISLSPTPALFNIHTLACLGGTVGEGHVPDSADRGGRRPGDPRRL